MGIWDKGGQNRSVVFHEMEEHDSVWVDVVHDLSDRASLVGSDVRVLGSIYEVYHIVLRKQKRQLARAIRSRKRVDKSRRRAKMTSKCVLQMYRYVVDCEGGCMQFLSSVSLRLSL